MKYLLSLFLLVAFFGCCSKPVIKETAEVRKERISVVVPEEKVETDLTYVPRINWYVPFDDTSGGYIAKPDSSTSIAVSTSKKKLYYHRISDTVYAWRTDTITITRHGEIVTVENPVNKVTLYTSIVLFILCIFGVFFLKK